MARYEIYGWDEDEKDDYFADYNMELEDALEKGYANVADYGTLLGYAEDEEEAYKLSEDAYSVTAIWDNKERIWFN